MFPLIIATFGRLGASFAARGLAQGVARGAMSGSSRGASGKIVPRGAKSIKNITSLSTDFTSKFKNTVNEKSEHEPGDELASIQSRDKNSDHGKENDTRTKYALNKDVIKDWLKNEITNTDLITFISNKKGGKKIKNKKSTKFNKKSTKFNKKSTKFNKKSTKFNKKSTKFNKKSAKSNKKSAKSNKKSTKSNKKIC
jgi:hypothetical protein